MLHIIAGLAAMATLTAAAPVDSPAPGPGPIIPNYPHASSSQGFRLVVNVTNPSLDFDTPINGFYVNSIHVGAARNLVGVTDYPGRIFYQNGTIEEWRYARSTMISDESGYPYGLSLAADDDNEEPESYTARLDVGFGTPGLVLSRFPEPYVFALWEQWVACDEALEYYSGRHFVILKRVLQGAEVPGNCVAVRLLPQCTALPELPDWAGASHEFALESACYEDVASLDWSQYGP
jgi:hypothetical protein